jgi:hypothetical protein
MTQLDSIEIKANVEVIPKIQLNLTSGTIDIYILTDNKNLVATEDMLGVILTQVAIEVSDTILELFFIMIDF